MSGINLTYSFACESACRSNSSEVRLHTCFGLKGRLMFSAERGRHTGPRQQGHWNRKLGGDYACQPGQPPASPSKGDKKKDKTPCTVNKEGPTSASKPSPSKPAAAAWSCPRPATAIAGTGGASN